MRALGSLDELFSERAKRTGSTLADIEKQESKAGKVESRRIKLYSTCCYFYIDFVLELELYFKCA